MSLPTLVIGTKNLSSWSLRPWLLLKHLQFDFEELLLPLDTPEFHDRIATLSPTARVPVLIDGDFKVWDSLAICEHASELKGGKGWPRDAKARALARSISAEMHAGFSALRTQWPMNVKARNLNVPATAETQRDINRVDAIWRQCLGANNGPWLFGDYSIADAMYAPVVLRFATYGAQVSHRAQQYMRDVLADSHLQAWLAAA